MLFFYLISLPLTLGMVLVTLRYFAGPDVPRYVIFTVGYTWFCSLSIIILVPADIWTTKTGRNNDDIAFFWSWSYWGTFILTWAVVPTLQGYEDAGDFTTSERLKTSIRANLVFYLTVGTISLFGLVLLVIMHKIWSGGIVGFAMACSNTFGLVTGAFLLGFGLSEIPKTIWSNADWDYRNKVLSHRVAKMAVNLDNAHQEFSNAIVVAQATSNQMPKRDPLRHCMDIIDKMVQQMFHEDPSFKPSGGRLGENDMDYDTDEQSMATLRRQLRRAREEYYRCKSLYMTSVIEALELEDTIKNYKRWETTEWKYISSFRSSRSGTLGGFLDTLEFIWRCMLRNQLEKVFSIILAIMSAAILLAEATLLPSGVNLSLFSMLINAVGNEEILIQITAFIPLMYMCICTYYSLFKIGMLMFYSFTPKQTSSVSLLMICSMVARYAPPISYNFLNLIYLGGNSKTVFEKRMGNIDEAVPFFGQGFNKIYPLIMVVYTLLVASNFFGRVFSFLGRWKRFKLQNEEENTDGFNPSGLMILQKEKFFLEQGHVVGEQVIPLARNFNNSSFDIESDNNPLNKPDVEMKADTSQNMDHLNAGQSKPPKDCTQGFNSTREQQIKMSSLGSKEKDGSLPVTDESQINRSNDQIIAGNTSSSSSGISTWASSMKTGFQRFKANLEAKKLLSTRQTQETNVPPRVSSSESLDEIFYKLKKRPSINIDDDFELDDDPSSQSNK